jgi:hypothetical protein
VWVQAHAGVAQGVCQLELLCGDEGLNGLANFSGAETFDGLCVEQATDGGLIHQFLNEGHGLLLLVVSEKHANRKKAKAHVHL